MKSNKFLMALALCLGLSSGIGFGGEFPGYPSAQEERGTVFTLRNGKQIQVYKGELLSLDGSFYVNEKGDAVRDPVTAQINSDGNLITTDAPSAPPLLTTQTNPATGRSVQKPGSSWYSNLRGSLSGWKNYFRDTALSTASWAKSQLPFGLKDATFVQLTGALIAIIGVLKGYGYTKEYVDNIVAGAFGYAASGVGYAVKGVQYVAEIPGAKPLAGVGAALYGASALDIIAAQKDAAKKPGQKLEEEETTRSRSTSTSRRRQ